MSWLFASGGQSIGASASASVHWIFNEISPSDEYSGLISFRIDWFDLLAVQRTLKSLVQHHGLKSISSSVFSLIYGSTLTSVHDYCKNNSFDYKDLCWLLSNMLILEPKKIKSICVSIFFPHLSAMKWWGWMPKTKNLFSHGSSGQKSKIRVLGGPISEGSRCAFSSTSSWVPVAANSPCFAVAPSSLCLDHHHMASSSAVPLCFHVAFIWGRNCWI